MDVPDNSNRKRNSQDWVVLRLWPPVGAFCQFYDIIVFNWQRQKGRKLGENWKTEIAIYTLLYIKYITNKDLLNTGNSPQYSVMAYMEKNLKKEWICCVCVTDSICGTPETNKTL